MTTRRVWLMAGAGGAALAVGLALGLRREAQRSGPATLAPPAEAGLWSQRFQQPAGGELAMADLRGRPLIVNFWATWCAPCVREMPMLEAFYQAHRAAGWQVLGLAIDGPTPVREFLKKVPISFPIGLAGLEGTELIRTLGNTAGGLPFSVLFDRQGQAVQRHMGELSAAQLQRWRSQG